MNEKFAEELCKEQTIGLQKTSLSGFLPRQQ